MNKIIMTLMMIIATPVWAMNETANMLRRCEGVNITNADNYILRCRPDENITRLVDGGVEQFFVADNGGDVRGSFLDSIPANTDYIYVNVVRNSPDPRYRDQTCYRFMGQRDEKRDGYYAVEVCEYERADYYL